MQISKKFRVKLDSSMLTLDVEIDAIKRNPSNYQIKRDATYELPKSSYEVVVNNSLSSLGVSSLITKEEMENHHIASGKDGNYYLCCFYMDDDNLQPTIQLWIAHQLLFVCENKDIVKTGDKPKDVFLRHGATLSITEL